jgi:hypothetical protein
MSQRDGISGTLTSGTAVVVTTSRCKLPATVAVYPVSGDTVTVEYSMNGSTWTAWRRCSLRLRAPSPLPARPATRRKRRLQNYFDGAQ